MEKHKLDKLFEDKLGDYQSTPSPEAWQTIEQSLNKRTNKFTWSLIGIAASASLVFFSSWYLLTADYSAQQYQYSYTDSKAASVDVPNEIVLVPILIQISDPRDARLDANNGNIIITENLKDQRVKNEPDVDKPLVVIAQNKGFELELSPVLQEPLPLEDDKEDDIVLASSKEVMVEEAQNTQQPLTIIYKQGAPVTKSKFTQAMNYMEEVRNGDKKLLDFKKLKESFQSKLKSNKEVNSK